VVVVRFNDAAEVASGIAVEHPGAEQPHDRSGRMLLPR
jgi:hypothetical protein